ncbi:hypothetical protein M9Y10_020850 [Tritrichomonas musculus]|uniref:Uncharacterized protein n=1 Tax=Tritrichomonas musculus TaxID=1915356 RepID=A0ABR2HEV8_9EUKA
MSKHPTLYDIEQISIQVFNKYFSVDTLSYYIIGSDKFRIVKGEPQEEDMVNVNVSEINNYWDVFFICVNGVHASLFLKWMRQDKMSTLTHIQ